ncbi:MAG TPA: N-6 DNA methylase [Solirubrobacteraceae bacterium]|jgi:type I restriction enzyme M protein
MTRVAIQTRLEEANSASGYHETFKRLYYHLYSNSSVSRAERLIEDLSLLLLSKLAAEVNGSRDDFVAFLQGEGSAEHRILTHLRTAAPDLVDASAQFAIDDATVRSSLLILDEVRVSAAPAHALGEAFQALIGPRLRGERGQFFTPRTLVRAMVEVVAPKAGEDVLDPACGTGGFLLEAIRYWEEHNVKPKGHVRGVDKDAGLARLAAAMLRIAYSGGADVLATNSLDLGTGAVESESADVVLTNPPFGAKIGITDAQILGAYDFGHKWEEVNAGGWDRKESLVEAQDPQILFLELCVRALRPGGRLGIVLPEGLFGNRKTGYIWDWIRSQGSVTALLDCPRTTFQPGTDTKTNVLFFQKGAARARAKVPVAVALHCGHDRRGRGTGGDGQPLADDFREIAADFNKPASRRSWWHQTQVTDPYYLVPRFYAPQEAREAREVALTQGASHTTLRELVDARLLTVRKGDEVGAETYGTGTIPFVRTSDISNFEINIDPTKCVDEPTYARYASGQALKAGDVLMVVDGRYRIGATALLTSSNARCVVQSHFRILGTTGDELDTYALLFALNLPSVRQGIRNLVFIQSTLGTLGQRLYRLEIPLLTGDGPWSESIRAFRETLVARDANLLKLREAVDGSEVEL